MRRFLLYIILVLVFISYYAVGLTSFFGMNEKNTIANYGHTRLRMEGIRDFLGHTYPVLHRSPVIASYLDVEFTASKVLNANYFSRQRSTEMSVNYDWHYDGDRMFQDLPGGEPESCKWHIFPCMFTNDLKSCGRLNKDI